MSDRLVTLAIGGAAALQAGQGAFRRAVGRVHLPELPSLALPAMPALELPSFGLPDCLRPAAIAAPALVRGAFASTVAGLLVPAGFGAGLMATASAAIAGPSAPIAGQIWPLGRRMRDAEFDGFVRFVRRRYPREPAACLAADLNIPVETAKQYLKRRARPGFGTSMAAVATYGPQLLAEMYPNGPGWFDEARRAADQAALVAELASLRARIDRVLA
jgi:hypothetical protein